MAILRLLAISKFDMSSSEILEAVPVDDKMAHTITSIRDHLESLKNSGCIENGLSEIVKGKTVLMWKITDNGRVLVSGNKSKIVEVEAIDEPAALLHSIENLDEKINMLRKMMAVVPAEWEAMLNEIIDDLSRIGAE